MSNETSGRNGIVATSALITAIAVGVAFPASAHEGPPFPILVDRPLSDYVVSVWADPDIGEALFYVILETPDGQIPSQPPEVSMWVEPVSGRLDRTTRVTTRQPLRSQMQFEAHPHFDQQDMWTVGIQIQGPDGVLHELATQVESTPPGYGGWGLAIYLFPFLLLGTLWIVAMIRRARTKYPREAPTCPTLAESTNHT